jgi:hypothetical protein
MNYRNVTFFLSFLSFSFISLAQNAATEFIVYWGSAQARLNAANHYHGVVQVKEQDILHNIYKSPLVWDGKKMLSITFMMDGMAFQNKDRAAFEAQMKLWDDAKPDKLENADTLHLSQITLAEGISGTLDIRILREPKTEKSVIEQGIETRVLNGEVTDLNESNIRVEYGVVSYRWGKYISYGNAQSPYMSISQFWETMQERPELLRTMDFQREQVEALLEIRLADNGTVNFVYPMKDTIPYRHFLENITFRKRIFKPNTLIYCAFRTDDSRDLNLCTHRIVLLADDDSRLSLTEKETTDFTLQWGKSFRIKKEKAFLKTLKNTKGEPFSADQNERIMHVINDLDALKKNPLELLVKDKKIVHWTCTFGNSFSKETKNSIDGKEIQVKEIPVFYDSKIGMTAKEREGIDTLVAQTGLLSIYDIKAEGFDFQPFSFVFMTKMNVQDILKEKNIFIGTPLVSLDGKSVHIDYELKIATIGNLKIEDSEGKELWVKSGDFKVGKFSAVATDLILEKGKKYKVVLALGLGREEKEFEY